MYNMHAHAYVRTSCADRTHVTDHDRTRRRVLYVCTRGIFHVFYILYLWNTIEIKARDLVGRVSPLN